MFFSVISFVMVKFCKKKLYLTEKTEAFRSFSSFNLANNHEKKNNLRKKISEMSFAVAEEMSVIRGK